jgi:hypothetical protein
VELERLHDDVHAEVDGAAQRRLLEEEEVIDARRQRGAAVGGGERRERLGHGLVAAGMDADRETACAGLLHQRRECRLVVVEQARVEAAVGPIVRRLLQREPPRREGTDGAGCDRASPRNWRMASCRVMQMAHLVPPSVKSFSAPSERRPSDQPVAAPSSRSVGTANMFSASGIIVTPTCSSPRRRHSR